MYGRAGRMDCRRRGNPRGPVVRTSDMRPEQEAQDRITETTLRVTTALGMVAIALIHFLDLFSKLRETPYLGVAYIALIAVSLVVGTQLVFRPGRSAWLGAGALAAAAVVAYTLSRSVGLPQANGDIGNWEEPLGLAALFVEGLVVLVSAYAAAARR